VIITRSPLRISLGGGGTDLPSYYRAHGGFAVAAAIDKYVYIALHQTFVPELIVKYSQMERVAHASEVRHPIIREAFRLAGLDGRYLELASMADIPAGTGLGSSGSFTTALLKALHVHARRLAVPRDVAEQASSIEIDRLGESVGKQDQYVSAFGGITAFEFRPDDTVDVRPLDLANETLYALEENLLLFFTGYTRQASAILDDQHRRSLRGDRDMEQNLDAVKELGRKSVAVLERGDLRGFAELLSTQWEYKKRRSAAASNPEIDAACALALKSGALGGKLIGAGGGGFLLFYAEDKARLRHALASTPLREVRFAFDFQGTRVVIE
jgi:D-glycero-alpha-D-manno-heptose-7-phosphate kinase